MLRYKNDSDITSPPLYTNDDGRSYLGELWTKNVDMIRVKQQVERDSLMCANASFIGGTTI